MKKTIAIVGGGAAGFFAALIAAETNSENRIIILEKARQVLSKVKISGGGRCNVTHACFEPATLVNYYPRGYRELRGAFSRFQPLNTIEWFQSKGVNLKTEEDGRMFPTTDSSETIIQCFLEQIRLRGIELRTETGVNVCEKSGDQFALTLSNEEKLICDRLLFATGSASKGYGLIKSLGHTIVSPVPSLFTFNIPNSPLTSLAGISIPKVKLNILEIGLEQTGPLLITHWGFSGPAVLKLSAWGARELFDRDYHATLIINWIPHYAENEIKQIFSKYRAEFSVRQIATESPFPIPKNLWKAFLSLASIPAESRWSSFSKEFQERLVAQLCRSTYEIKGKTTYKEEFVTSGGVALSEINFKTMESRLCPGLFFAGEVVDIDGVTGGFNFQNAWTTGWLAGKAM